MRPLLTLLAFAALATCVLLFLSGETGETVEVKRESVDAPGNPTASIDRDLDAPPALERIPSRRTLARQSERSSVAATRTDPRTLAVRVVRAGDGSRGVSATVYWSTPQKESLSTASGTFLERVRERGERGETDESGELVIDLPWNNFRGCAVTADGWYGECIEPAGFKRLPDAGPVVITVEPPADLRVVIQDESGAPVPFAGLCVFEDGSSYPRRQVRADQRGIAVAPGIQSLIGGESFDIRAVAYGGAGEQRRVSMTEIREATEPIPLTLGACGEVEVRVSPADAQQLGRRVTEFAPQLRSTARERGGVRLFNPAGPAPLATYDSSGVARIRPVAIPDGNAARFVVKAGFGNLEQEADGPSAPGEIRRIELTADWGASAVAICRVTRDGGEAAGNIKATVRVQRGDGRENRESFYGLPFDGSGEARWVLGPGEAISATISIEAKLDGIPYVGSAGPVSGLVAGPDGAAAGVLDFGSIDLSPGDVILRGRVVDDSGAPILDRVDLELEVKRPDGPDMARTRVFAAAFGDDADWGSLGTTYRWSEGQFTFYGDPNESRDLRVRASEPLVLRGDLDRGQSVRIGDDVTLTAGFGGILRGCFAIDADSTPWEGVAFQIVRVADAGSAAEDPPRIVTGEAKRTGSGTSARCEVVWEGLSKGRYAARICGSQAEPLLEFGEVDVPGTGVPTQLSDEPIDLRGVLRALSVTLQSPGGEAVNAGTAFSRRSGTTGSFLLLTGGIRSIPFVEPLDLRIPVEGYEDVFLRGVDADVSVTLVPYATIDVECENPSPGTRLRVTSEGTPFTSGGFHFRRLFGVMELDTERADRVEIEIDLNPPADGGSAVARAQVRLPASGLPFRIESLDPARAIASSGSLTSIPTDRSWRVRLAEER
ncbi:MAG: hypothetical protein AAF726_17960 [Planctomycetota bacterium]